MYLGTKGVVNGAGIGGDDDTEDTAGPARMLRGAVQTVRILHGLY